MKNAGKYAGAEVVMVYGDKVKNGVRELIGFEKVNVARGKKVKVTITVAEGYRNVSTSRV